MNPKLDNVIQSKSEITYNYATIKITQSRIDKGLLAIPTSLSKFFPDHNETIQLYLSDLPDLQEKQYSSSTSATRENRIGGLKQWFEQNKIKSGDELVIQFFDNEHFVYRLVPERNFVAKTKGLQKDFDKSKTEEDAEQKISILSDWTSTEKNRVVINEYLRLSAGLPSQARKYALKSPSRERENVPASLRTLLSSIYKGHCQVCDFWFLEMNKRPFYEVHHIDPQKEHHLKNILVVCGNCHNQFSHANVKHEFNDDYWLIKVYFNSKLNPINHLAISMKPQIFLKQIYADSK